MNFLYIGNDFLEWFELYKGHVFLILAFLDSYLIYKIGKIDQEKLKANIYLSTHLKYGIAKINTIKIGIAIFAFLFPPTFRGATLFASTIILVGVVIGNFGFFVVLYFKKREANI